MPTTSTYCPLRDCRTNPSAGINAPTCGMSTCCGAATPNPIRATSSSGAVMRAASGKPIQLQPESTSGNQPVVRVRDLDQQAQTPLAPPATDPTRSLQITEHHADRLPIAFQIPGELTCRDV